MWLITSMLARLTTCSRQLVDACCLSVIKEPETKVLTEVNCRLHSMVCNAFRCVVIRLLCRLYCCLRCYWAWQCTAKNLGCDSVTNNNQFRVEVLTFNLPMLQIPTWSHNPTKYHPRFQPLCSPEIPWNLTTFECKLHFPLITSIQWAVIPRYNTFVLLAVQPSAVDDILSGAF